MRAVNMISRSVSLSGSVAALLIPIIASGMACIAIALSRIACAKAFQRDNCIGDLQFGLEEGETAFHVLGHHGYAVLAHHHPHHRHAALGLGHYAAGHCGGTSGLMWLCPRVRGECRRSYEGQE